MDYSLLPMNYLSKYTINSYCTLKSQDFILQKCYFPLIFCFISFHLSTHDLRSVMGTGRLSRHDDSISLKYRTWKIGMARFTRKRSLWSRFSCGLCESGSKISQGGRDGYEWSWGCHTGPLNPNNLVERTETKDFHRFYDWSTVFDCFKSHNDIICLRM